MSKPNLRVIDPNREHARDLAHRLVKEHRRRPVAIAAEHPADVQRTSALGRKWADEQKNREAVQKLLARATAHKIIIPGPLPLFSRLLRKLKRISKYAG